LHWNSGPCEVAWVAGTLLQVFLIMKKGKGRRRKHGGFDKE